MPGEIQGVAEFCRCWLCCEGAEGEGRPQRVVRASQWQAARGVIDLGSADPSAPRCRVRSGCGLWSASFRAAFWAWRG